MLHILALSPGAPASSGWEVVTPLQCTDGCRVLVNRGWVPREAVESISHPTGSVRVRGILKAGDQPNKFAENNDASRRYVWFDLHRVAEETASTPVYITETADGATVQAQGVWPRARPLETFAAFHVEPSTHLVYAGTWASLAVFGTVMTINFMKRLR